MYCLMTISLDNSWLCLLPLELQLYSVDNGINRWVRFRTFFEKDVTTSRPEVKMFSSNLWDIFSPSFQLMFSRDAGSFHLRYCAPISTMTASLVIPLLLRVLVLVALGGIWNTERSFADIFYLGYVKMATHVATCTDWTRKKCPRANTETYAK